MSGTYFRTYKGTVHQTGEHKIYHLQEKKSPIEMLEILSRLNKDSHVYGVTYWVEVPA